MTRAIVGLVGVLACLVGAARADAAPAELYGKSVLVTWSEDREQRGLGENRWNYIRINLELRLYVSTAGRVFNRLNAVVVDRNGRSHSFSADQIAAADRSGHGQRQVHFDDRSMALDAVFNGGARHIAVAFDASYGSCKAQVIAGRQEGSQTTIMTTLNHRKVEIRSNRAGTATCSVRNGNVFAGQ